MKSDKNQNFLQKFLESEKEYPVLAAISAGLYPLIHYFSNNFSLANTWGHLQFFVTYYLLVPIVVFLIGFRISKLPFLRKWQKYILPLMNIFTFLFLMELSIYTLVKKKLALGLLLIAVVLTLLLYKHLKKIITIQLLLASMALLMFLFTFNKLPEYPKDWLEQPDAIDKVVFKKKPNVYFIQPDGYPSFSELTGSYYNLDISEFQEYLLKNNFKTYAGFRNNYASTLASNSSIFMMKHHYYNNGPNLNEALYARDVIVSKNTVLDVFKNNGYTTHLITETPYLFMNRPDIGYDTSNFEIEEVPYISTGLANNKDVVLTLKESMRTLSTEPNFFFVEFISPGHIRNNKFGSDGKEQEREQWIEKLDIANHKLKSMIDLIKDKDPNSLVVILADHGGYVGFDYAREMYKKTEDRDLKYSIFGSLLSIHWPNNEIPVYDDEFKSSVNTFRILFSYLSENEVYLKHLQENSSYIILNEDAPKGVYKYIDTNGKSTFKKQ